MNAERTPSLRRRLLVGILGPVLVFVGINSLSLYRQALQAADTAYDRTLLASAKSIGELLEVSTVDGRTFVQSTLPYSALESFEADNRSRMFFRVSGFDGEIRVTGTAQPLESYLTRYEAGLPPARMQMSPPIEP